MGKFEILKNAYFRKHLKLEVTMGENICIKYDEDNTKKYMRMFINQYENLSTLVEKY